MKANLLCIVSILIMLLHMLPATAQYAKPDEIEEMKKRKLLVQIAEPDPEILANLKEKKPDLVQYYKAAIETYNNNLTQAVANFWPYQSEFKTVNRAEAKDLKKSKNKDYIIIYQNSISYRGSAYDFRLIWEQELIEDELIKYHMFTSLGRFALQVSFSEDYGGKIIAAIESNRYLPTKTEMACMIYEMSLFDPLLSVNHPTTYVKIPKDTIREHCNALKEMTLLININSLSADLSLEKIKNIYPYSIEVLNDDQIDEIIFSKKEGYAYLYFYPVFQQDGAVYAIWSTINFSSRTGLGYCILNPMKTTLKQMNVDIKPDKIIDEKIIEMIVANIKWN